VTARGLGALAAPRLRLYLIGQLCSLTGTWAQQVAVAWLVFRLTQSSAVVGLSVALAQLPILLLAPLAGVVGDRVDRRRMLLVTQVAGAGHALVLGVLARAGALHVPLVLVLSLGIGVINAFDTPARQALVPRLVDRPDDIRNAVAWNSANLHVARLLGPAVAAILLSRFDIAACCFANAASYAVSFGILARLRATAHEPIRTRAMRALGEGLRYCAGDREVRRVLALVGATSLVAIPYTALLPAATQLWSGPQAPAYARLMSAGGLGAVAAALTLVRMKHDLKLAFAMPVALLVSGATLLLLGLAGGALSPAPLTAAVALLGFALTLVISGGNIVLQQRVPEQLRGRVLGLFVLAFNGVMPLGALLLGSLADRLGAPGALAAAGTATGLAAIAALSRGARVVARAA
jgi:MFS family permease